MGGPTVSIVHLHGAGPTREQVVAGVERAMDLAGWREHVPRGAAVALKPNLGWDLFLPGSITSPWVFEGVVRAIRGWVGAIHVIESDQVLVDVEKAFHLSGIDRVCAEYGLSWVNMSLSPMVTVPLPRGRVLREIQIPEIILRTHLITIPVMKTHNKTTVTGALKNQWGCLPRFRHNYHLVLDAALADINSVARPCFAVMDATIGLEGNSPKSGLPRVVDRLLASADPVALDAVAAKVMGFDPARIGHLRECSEAGLGVLDADRITVVGDDDLALNLRFIPARHNMVSWMELALRRGPRLRKIFFDGIPFRICCALARVYYSVWYSMLGVGRRRKDRILRSTSYGAQWKP